MADDHREPVAAAHVDSARTQLARRQRRARWLLLGLLAILVMILGWQWRERQPGRRYQRAVEALARQDLQAVRRELNGWPNDAAHEPRRHYLQGHVLLADGETVPAIEEFLAAGDWTGARDVVTAVEPSPTSAIATKKSASGQHHGTDDVVSKSLTEAGRLLYQLGRQPEAIGPLEDALERDPNNIEAHRWIASCYYDLGVTPVVRDHLNRVAELDPDDPRPFRLIGLMHKDFEHYDEAIAAYQEALRRKKPPINQAEVMLELAECQVKLRQFNDALHSLGLCEPSAQRDVLQAECHLALGNLALAQKHLAVALASEPDSLSALLMSASLDLEASEVQAAVNTLRVACQRYPRDYIARYRLSQALRRLGRADEAEKEATVAEKIKQMRDQFTKLHEQASQDPGNPEIRHALGMTALALDQPELAVNWFRMALALSPDHQPSREALAALLKAQPPEGR